MSSIASYFQPLFYPSSVAVIGASNTPDKWGFGILHNLINGGFEGKVLPINKKGGTIQGLASYTSVLDLPEPPDLGMVIVPPPTVIPALKDLVKKRARSAVIITAGFGELGPEGKSAEAEMKRIADRAQIPVIGPNCQGIMSAHVNLFAQIMFFRPGPGPLSIVSQSGNIGGSLMHYGNVNGIGFNKFVSSGNEAATRMEEVIEYLGEDESTGAVLIYVEGVRDGRAFFEACRRVSLKKPIVCLKGGETEAGAQACSSHTGALAGSHDLFTAACRQAGVITVDDLDELFYVASALVAHPLPRGRRVGIVTMGGGWGVLAADACAKEGLLVTPLPRETISRLNGFLADRWSHGNPVDLAATPERGAIFHALKAVVECDVVDGVIQTGLGFGGAIKKYVERDRLKDESKIRTSRFTPEVADLMAKGDLALAQAIINLSQEQKKPILSCTDVILGDSVLDNQTLEFIAGHGMNVYPTPGRAARVLGKIADYAQWRGKTLKEIN